jgi:hypothetical protein
MNEKIRELAEQVNVDIIEPEYAKIGGVSEVSFETYQDLEKFAELIIKETLEIVRDEVSFFSDWNCADAAIKKVNEHFGMEE